MFVLVHKIVRPYGEMDAAKFADARRPIVLRGGGVVRFAMFADVVLPAEAFAADVAAEELLAGVGMRVTHQVLLAAERSDAVLTFKRPFA